MRKILSIIALVTVIIFAVACKKTTYNVTFEPNGGSAVLPAIVEKDKLLEEPDAPTKTGFTFDGWFKESALTNEWNFAEDVVTEDITLYAKWMATDAHLVDLAYDWLTLGDLSALTIQSARIIFPTTKDGVTISWDIDKDEYIAANGMISQPTHEEGTQTVTLTATLTKGSASREKEFTATVVALPNPEDAEPLINETFEGYADGNILTQDGIWGTVSGKAGNSLFTVVSSVTPAIPSGSKALKIEALKELQIEAPIVHDYDLVVFEVDLLQTTSSGGSAVNIQTSSSSPVVGFGLDGAALFYRTDNGDLMKTSINVNQWYTLRVEIDLVNKTIEAFYYEDGQLIPITPGKVNYSGSLPLQSIFIRSGSSTTEVLRAPAYVTNLVANRIEALPRPVEEVKLGEVTDIRSIVSVEVGTTFTPDVPKVYNFFGSRGLLVKDTDYTIEITNPVDMDVPAIYTVTYTITNKDDATDVKVVNQSVTVYTPTEPNEITGATSTVALYEEKLSTITVTVVQPEGTLYYLLSNNAAETKEAIILGEQKTIDDVTVTLTDLDVEDYIYIHFYVELNGDSNILAHEINRQEVVEIATPQAFYDAIHLSESNQRPKYFLLTDDIDFTDYTWVVASTTKLWTTLNGDNHTISNLTIDRSVRGGIFSDLEDATIKNLIIDNVNVVSSVGVSTVLVGETRGTVLIENVIMMNSSIEITDATGGSDYAALFVGRIRGGTLTMKHISAIDSSVLNHSEYTGGIIAGQDTTRPVFMSDIYMKNVTVQEDSTTGQMVGGVIGRVQAEFVLERFVGININLIGIKNVGGIVGKFDDGIPSVITDVYLKGEVSTFDPETLTKGSVGGLADVTPTLTNIWVSGFTHIMASGVSVDVAHVVDHSDVMAESWWTTNIFSIASNSDWGLDENDLFALNNYLVLLKPLIEVTLDYNFDFDNEVISIRQDEVFDHEAPSVPGYAFVGWFTDDTLETPYEENPLITAPITIYGKYEVVPASEVSFVTGVEGLIIPTQAINYGELATAPIVEDQMIGGVKKELTGWTLNGEPFNFATPITEAIELVAVWQTVSLTVTFDGDHPVQVLYGELVTAPAEVPTHYFSEVTFKEWRLLGVAYDFDSPVIENINLVSAFNDPVSISIDNVDEFHHMATVESTWNYVLSTDLDFTGFEWTYVNTSFKGTFDGQNFTVSNLTMTGLTNYAGIFPRANGATIKNLVLDNITIATTARAGILVGRIENGDTVIENILIKNSSVQGSDSNGVGGLVGQVSRYTEIMNVAIINTTVHNTVVNVGGFVGRVDKATLLADDIFVKGVTVISDSGNSSDVAAAAFVGYIVNDAASILTAARVVVLDTTVNGNVTAAYVGYNRYPGTTSLQDAYFEVTFVNNERSGLIGYNRDQVDVLVQSSIFGKVTNDTPHAQVVSLTNEVVPGNTTWWTTNLPNIATSENWEIYSNTQYGLKLYTDTLPALVVATHTYNITADDNLIYYRVGDIHDFVAPVVDGYGFEGWFLDELLTTSVPAEYTITEAVTIYGKYEAIPPSQVSFTTNVEGVTVATQDINYGQLATKPVVANQMIADVLHEVTGWTLNGEPFSFLTPIIEDIELVAVWEPVTYTVTFDGKDPIEILHGELVSEPEEDPVHIFSERIFVEWRLSGLAYDFDTPVVSTINLVAHFADPAGSITITTLDQFYTMATVESMYTYELANDLDFTGFEWTYVNTSFKGTFDGQNFTVSNLTMTGLTNIAGIFPRANGATIKNLVLDNITIATTARAGILVGRIENGDTVIENILIKNSSVQGSDSNGVGGLVGHVARNTEIMNVAIINTTVHNTAVNVGGFVGRVDKATLLSDDIFVKGVTVKSDSENSSDVAASAFVGYIVNDAASILSAARVVVLNTTVDGNVTAAYVGYNRYPGTTSLQDAYFGVTFVNNERSGLIGYNRDQVDPLDQSSIFGTITNDVPHSQALTLTNNVLAPDNAGWWTTNLVNIATSDTWVINVDGTVTLALLVE